MAELLTEGGIILLTVLAGTLYYGVFGQILDVFLLAAALALQNRPAIWGAHFGAVKSHGMTLLVVVAATFGAARVGRWAWATADPLAWTGPGKPLLFPCRTTHSRLFPKMHSFSYSYLVVGIPVGWEGAAGGIISADIKERAGSSFWSLLGTSSQKAWFNVDAGDYLERGNGYLGLRGKLNAYLRSQGVDPARYPHAYLVTAARFAGYHFNPASFWYLYGPDKALAAMIVEVNNTFDERRMYFLLPDAKARLEASEYEATIDDGEATEAKHRETTASQSSFTQTWSKDFHVSPFNSRKGSYSISACDPLRSTMQGTGPISNTIVLRSSKAHGKIVARLFSERAALDPTMLSPWQKLKFLTAWFWVGFVTFPRIAKEAGALFFKRRLHVWFRPEPLKESIGRNADATEGHLELVFRRYLRHLVEQSAAPIAVKYMAGGISAAPKELMLTPAAADGSDAVEEVEFKVLTPAFYSRFVHYAHDLEALFCEFRESSTIWVSRPELLPRLVLKRPPPKLDVKNLADFVFFQCIKYLRRRPERIEHPMTWPSAPTAAGGVAVTDIRDFRISSMDGFVLASEDSRMRKAYRVAVLKLFIADRTAFGTSRLLEAQCFIVRASLAWVFSRRISGMITQTFNYLQRHLDT